MANACASATRRCRYGSTFPRLSGASARATGVARKGIGLRLAINLARLGVVHKKVLAFSGHFRESTFPPRRPASGAPAVCYRRRPRACLAALPRVGLLPRMPCTDATRSFRPSRPRWLGARRARPLRRTARRGWGGQRASLAMPRGGMAFPERGGVACCGGCAVCLRF